MSNRVITFARGLTRTLEKIMAALLFAMFAVVLLLVILRYFFSTTIIGGNEATAVAFVFLTAIGAAIDLFKDRHISIGYFVNKMSAVSKQRIATIRFALLVLLNAVVLFYSIVWIARTGSFMMPALGLPQWLAQMCVPLGCALSIFYCVLRLRVARVRASSTPDMRDQD